MLVEPFQGFVCRFEADFDSGPESAHSLALLEWSRRHPAVIFVYLHVECDGGECINAGFVFRDGNVVHEEPFDGASKGSPEPLRRLMFFFGVDLGPRAFFAPLTRGFV